MVSLGIRRVDARGFSLAELIIVVAVIGVLSAIGMPYFISYYRASALKGGAQEVVALLNQGRQIAIKENEAVCIKSDVANPNYGTKIRYLRGSCTAANTCAATGNVSPCIWTGAGTDQNGYVTLSENIQVRPPATDVTFTYLGASSGGSYTVRVVTNTSATSTVTVAASGRISYAFP